MEYQGWSVEFSPTHRPDNLHIEYVGSIHPLLAATDVVLVYFPYRTFYNMCRLYLSHLAFHRDDKTISQFFATHLHFYFYLPVGKHFANTIPYFEQYSPTILFLVH